MLSKEEIQEAKSKILRGNDIESACLIMKTIIWDGLVQVGGRVNITKVAMRQILNFIEEYKNKGYLDVVREKVQANEKIKQLEAKEQKLIEKLEEMKKNYKHRLETDIIDLILEIVEGGLAMSRADLKRNLEAELLKIERQNRSWSTGETRYDRMIEDVLRYIDNSISKEVIENKIEENKKEYRKIHAQHYRDCGILENRTQAKILAYQELLEGK